MLLALLLPDPSDEFCPADFKDNARIILRAIQTAIGPTDTHLQRAPIKFIGDFSNNDLAARQQYLDISHLLIKAAHDQERPAVVDTFAGGGSIPLEALRLGCESVASDINPVACLILKTLIDDIPRLRSQLVEEMREVGQEISAMVERELREFYPNKGGNSGSVYLWARTVRCEAPHCHAEIPLMRTFWLSKEPTRKRALRFSVSKIGVPDIQLEVFEPRSEAEVSKRTISNAKATCLLNRDHVLAADRLRSQLREQHGGADPVFDSNGGRIGGARMLVVATSSNARHGREYRVANARDYEAVWRAAKALRERELNQPDEGLTVVPHEIISLNEVRRVSVPLYGAVEWSDIWTARQKLVLTTYAKAIRSVAMSEACRRMIALAFDLLVMQLSAHCRWKSSGESLIDMFGRHAIGMVWDFAEASPGFGGSNIFDGWVKQLARFITHMNKLQLAPGQVFPANACSHPLPDESCSIWFTDPPYYDSIPYAHLSDCFYVWLKRLGLEGPERISFATELTPKDEECVVDRPHRLSKSKKDAFLRRAFKPLHQKVGESRIGPGWHVLCLLTRAPRDGKLY